LFLTRTGVGRLSAASRGRAEMKAIAAAVAFAVWVVPGAALAGWGAIAYNSATGAWGEAHGYGTQADAESAALGYCGGGCQIINYEENSCIALATGPGGAWGEGHGYSTSDEAIATALSYCGGGCSWRAWACN